MSPASHILVLGSIALAAASCATTPATVKRIEFADQCRCSLEATPLGELLGLALAGPESAGSNHALAHFVERWKVERGSTARGAVTVGATPYRVRFDGEGNALGYFDRISPAIDYQVGDLDHHRRAGHGAPLVALRENRRIEPIEAYSGRISAMNSGKTRRFGSATRSGTTSTTPRPPPSTPVGSCGRNSGNCADCSTPVDAIGRCNRQPWWRTAWARS